MQSTITTRRVAARFERETSFWQNVYRADDVFAVIHQHRLTQTLAWIDELKLPTQADVLDVGCGAGIAAVTLCQRGFRVAGVDPSLEMLAATERHALEAGIADRLSRSAGDAQALMFPNETFDLVVALGVVPWLHAAEGALHEMSRVLKPNGYLILNCDNRVRLTYLLDPLATPWLVSQRKCVKLMLEPIRAFRQRPPDVRPTMHSVAELDRLLLSAGLEKLSFATFGFGPFTLFGRKILPGALGVAVHRRLQRAAECGSSVLRKTGAQYIVLSRKVAG